MSNENKENTEAIKLLGKINEKLGCLLWIILAPLLGSVLIFALTFLAGI